MSSGVIATPGIFGFPRWKHKKPATLKPATRLPPKDEVGLTLCRHPACCQLFDPASPANVDFYAHSTHGHLPPRHLCPAHALLAQDRAASAHISRSSIASSSTEDSVGDEGGGEVACNMPFYFRPVEADVRWRTARSASSVASVRGDAPSAMRESDGGGMSAGPVKRTASLANPP
ncbi:hypothetical protein EJ06DRAFT_527108 [Trichodelitschia bisporula]|uniref:Uncharacterized protein n=1 Tax=Trichodelitschia bisporula TaxID=703511 RepID=A0A6G1I664_9PEZI|nr:hypothetical protein EJ06DRAFT_527108 [Trichodelitschia bisporula]